MVEIEVKIRIKEDLKETAKKLLAAGAKLLRERHFEENTLYDFPGQTLKNKREAVRLRQIKKKTYLTFKGPPIKSRRFKIREEFETEVKNAGQLKKILKRLGLSPSFSYSKYRTVFKFKKLKIVLDETEAGNFIEFEGERSDIVRFARSMGYSNSSFITEDYVSILTASKKIPQNSRNK
jgi:predicted adenylyl cyclase CyaB